MGFGDKVREKRTESAAVKVDKMLSHTGPEDSYAAMEVASWGDVTLMCNEAAKKGWRLHSLRDGLRGNGIDLGYRLLFERDQMQMIQATIDGLNG
jgi:hypothetical protein